MRELYEKLGLFYLGKEIDKSTMQASETLTLLKNKNFTTHAAIIGMTGSGKTGLGVSMIEEACIDNIPSIIIDPKGDMGDLCLADPEFSAKSFEPWVADEAKAKEKELSAYAAQTAATWKEGIESWHQDASRVRTFQNVPKTIYTPGSTAGVSINIMSSLERPPSEIMEESDAFASYLKSTTVSLLSLVGITADPMDSKEYILLAQIITKAWLADEEVSIESLIGKIISPSFKKIGVLPLERFYAQDERFKLASKFNSLLASPSFSLWLQGETLDIQKLLYDENGKAKVAIFSISHLNDDERMFFVTLLLNKYIAWMRRQSGTSALKTLLYMDEIFGFFPPTKNPPSKEPMLLLLKQARAFGVGIILSTQNPVDLDYKGLSNIGMWFIGRLQTTQDIDRVIDGLGGKIGSTYEKSEIKAMLSNLQKRTFFLKSAHLDDIRLFTTRWVLSYLKGPLKRDEIATLMKAQKEDNDLDGESAESMIQRSQNFMSYQNIDKSIPQYFEPDSSGQNNYVPTLMAEGNVHFYSQSRGIDEAQPFNLSLELEKETVALSWEEGREEDFNFMVFPHKAPSKAQFSPLPELVLKDKGLRAATSDLKAYLYQNKKIELFRCTSPKRESRAGESKADFMVRLQDLLSEKKEAEIEKLNSRYAAKEKVLTARLQRAKERVEKESSDSLSSMIDVGIATLSGLFTGRGLTATKISRAIKKGSNVLKERGDMSRAEERVAKVVDDIALIHDELEEKISLLDDKYNIDQCEISTFSIKPRKTDIAVEECAIVWRVS